MFCIQFHRFDFHKTVSLYASDYDSDYDSIASENQCLRIKISVLKDLFPCNTALKLFTIRCLISTGILFHRTDPLSVGCLSYKSDIQSIEKTRQSNGNKRPRVGKLLTKFSIRISAINPLNKCFLPWTAAISYEGVSVFLSQSMRIFKKYCSFLVN